MALESLNYATEYSATLNQAFPYQLYVGELFASPNNTKYKFLNAQSISIPHITIEKGSKNADRDTTGGAFERNYNKKDDVYKLNFHREWSTMVNPVDLDETNYAISIGNITKEFNERQRFPEMNAYTISKIYSDWTTAGNVPSNTVLAEDNILIEFDELMLKMDNALVPEENRILFVTYEAYTLLKNAQGLTRHFDVQNNNNSVIRHIDRLDQVMIKRIPNTLMMTAYDFDEGYKVGAGAKQIHMMLIHDSCILTPFKVDNAMIQEPTTLSRNKWTYYEEYYFDVFVLKQSMNAVQMNVGA